MQGRERPEGLRRQAGEPAVLNHVPARFGQAADDRLDDIVAENAERTTDFMTLYFDNDEFHKALTETTRKHAYRIITTPARDEALARKTGVSRRERAGWRGDRPTEAPTDRSVVQQAQIARYDTSVPNIAQLIQRIQENGEVSTPSSANNTGIRRRTRCHLPAHCSDRIRVSQGRWPRCAGLLCADRMAGLAFRSGRLWTLPLSVLW